MWKYLCTNVTALCHTGAYITMSPRCHVSITANWSQIHMISSFYLGRNGICTLSRWRQNPEVSGCVVVQWRINYNHGNMYVLHVFFPSGKTDASLWKVVDVLDIQISGFKVHQTRRHGTGIYSCLIWDRIVKLCKVITAAIISSSHSLRLPESNSKIATILQVLCKKVLYLVWTVARI